MVEGPLSPRRSKRFHQQLGQASHQGVRRVQQLSIGVGARAPGPVDRGSGAAHGPPVLRLVPVPCCLSRVVLDGLGATTP